MGRPILNADGQKLCTTCGKPGTFTKAPMGHMGLAAECNACRNLYRCQPERRAVARAWAKAYRAKHPDRHMGDREKNALRQRRYKLRRAYGLTLAEWDAIVARQCGRCALCPEPVVSGRAHVDHDHNTGRVRGVLCGSCNRALGMFKDDPSRMRRAAFYVEYHQRAAE